LQLLPQFISEFNSEKWSIFAEVIVNIKVVYYFLRPGFTPSKSSWIKEDKKS